MKTSNKGQAGSFIKKGGIVLLACTLLFSTVKWVSAYFSDYEESVNTFTVGKISIKHREDLWDKLPEEDKKNIAPNQQITKDPKVENTGENTAFVFQVVEVPCKEVITANADGAKNTKTLTDLFSYSVNSGWTLLKTEDVTADGKVTAHRYSYVYGSADVCTPLETGAVTATLFDAVTMANIVEGQGIETTALDIVIDAYGIQTTDLGASDTTKPLEVYEIVLKQAK